MSKSVKTKVMKRPAVSALLELLNLGDHAMQHVAQFFRVRYLLGNILRNATIRIASPHARVQTMGPLRAMNC